MKEISLRRSRNATKKLASRGMTQLLLRTKVAGLRQASLLGLEEVQSPFAVAG
jgi:hypothetical protein